MPLIQTKPKEAGAPTEAVQFLGDPTVHPCIWWCPEEKLSYGRVNKAHWRLGGESHGGGYDSSSLYLEVGDWIYGVKSKLTIIHPDEFERDWQLVEPTAENMRKATSGTREIRHTFAKREWRQAAGGTGMTVWLCPACGCWPDSYAQLPAKECYNCKKQLEATAEDNALAYLVEHTGYGYRLVSVGAISSNLDKTPI